jgi:hypothetical protein
VHYLLLHLLALKKKKEEETKIKKKANFRLQKATCSTMRAKREGKKK